MKCRYFLVLFSLNLFLFNPSSSVPFQEVKTEVILRADFRAGDISRCLSRESL